MKDKPLCAVEKCFEDHIHCGGFSKRGAAVFQMQQSLDVMLVQSPDIDSTDVPDRKPWLA